MTVKTRVVESLVKSVSNHPVTALRLLLNGWPYQGQAGLKRIDLSRLGEVKHSWTINWTRGKHTLYVQPESVVGKAVSDPVAIFYASSHGINRVPNDKNSHKPGLPQLVHLGGRYLGVSRKSQTQRRGTRCQGNHSNRDSVYARIAGSGWIIVWAETINEAEYAKLTAAIALSVVTENPALLKWYFDDYLEPNVARVKQQLPGVAENVIYRAVSLDLKQRGTTYSVGKVGIQGGIATYHRWHTVRFPDGTERYKIHGPFGSWTWGYHPKFKTVERRTNLPNWNQPYLAIRF